MVSVLFEVPPTPGSKLGRECGERKNVLGLLPKGEGNKERNGEEWKKKGGNREKKMGVVKKKKLGGGN